MQLIKRILFIFILINSHFVFADTIAATATIYSSDDLPSSTVFDQHCVDHTYKTWDPTFTPVFVSTSGTLTSIQFRCSIVVNGTTYKNVYQDWFGTNYTCPSGYFRSDSSGNASSSGTYCTKDVDPCDSLKGQQIIINALYPFGSSTCVDSCIAAIGSYTSDGKSAGYYYPIYASYTGLTCTGSEDVQSVDASTADASNTAKVEADRIAKEEAACGGAGYYQTGTYNGSTVVTCTKPVSENNSTTTTTSTVDNGDGSTTTTTVETTTKDNTTTNSNGTTSGGSTTTTKTTVTTTNADGSSSSTVTESTSGAESTEQECTDSAGCEEADTTSLSDAIQLLKDDDQAVQDLISGGGPGLPVDGFGFGNGTGEGDGSGSWFWPVGSCGAPAIPMSVGQMSANMDLSEFCAQWNSTANPIISWMIRILTMIYIFFLWDKTISDLTRIK